MPEVTVEQGDSVASIAYERGLFWETVWNHPDNAELKERRAGPNILLAGDVVFVPDKELKQESVNSGQSHRFRRKGVPERLGFRLLDEENAPRANVPYVLEIDENRFEGTTDEEGFVEVPIVPNARSGRLIVGESGGEEYQILLSHLDPIDEISGIQARLNNLGYNRVVGDTDGELGPETTAALRAFQREHNLPVTGELDDATRSELEAAHGS